MLAGRPHEAAGNGSPRWMTAAPRKRAHRTRPTGRLTPTYLTDLGRSGQRVLWFRPRSVRATANIVSMAPRPRSAASGKRCPRWPPSTTACGAAAGVRGFIRPAERIPGTDDNRDFKEHLVREGRAHAALVCDGDVAVGWCEYGFPEELPNIYHKKDYQAGLDELPTYRLTCFFVDRNYRRKGVAALAPCWQESLRHAQDCPAG
jgi:hypothetical protein